jgi:hypothetical protein
MGARAKLNIAYLNGCLVSAGAVGMLTGSWPAFWTVLLATLLASTFGGGIRMRSRNRGQPRAWQPQQSQHQRY